MNYKVFSNLEGHPPFHRFVAYQLRVSVYRDKQELIRPCNMNEFARDGNIDESQRLLGWELS